MFLFRSFNPLQVSYKQMSKNLLFPFKTRFQSLIGQLQTLLAIYWLEREAKVSIPYRLATNSSRNIHKNAEQYLFQSLIGQLQTNHYPLPFCPKRYCFNPLQVSYKLNRKFATSSKDKGFQSLIGQLQTCEKLCPVYHRETVSIPYRLATNLSLFMDLLL